MQKLRRNIQIIKISLKVCRCYRKISTHLLRCSSPVCANGIAEYSVTLCNTQACIQTHIAFADGGPPCCPRPRECPIFVRLRLTRYSPAMIQQKSPAGLRGNTHRFDFCLIWPKFAASEALQRFLKILSYNPILLLPLRPQLKFFTIPVW